MIYTIHTDPGHGWLEVTQEELERLNIHNQISTYSYRKGDTVFLEEDCDMPVFIQAKKAANEAFHYLELHTNNDHWIRLLPYVTNIKTSVLFAAYRHWKSARDKPQIKEVVV